ncbi:MAG: BtrH N-terminal domain-containing protein [Solirubrobacterales bacterium]
MSDAPPAPTPDAGAVTVPGFEHRPGNHCGSTALRNLLGHHGLDVSEAMAFGLGAGPCFYYVPLDESPSRFINGRAARLEEQFIDLTGLGLVLEEPGTGPEAWDRAREVIDDGRPVILLTDLYELEYYGRSARFPGHGVVLAGYDDKRAWLADTGFAELQTTSLESLALARSSQHPVFPLSGHMISVPAGERLARPADRVVAEAIAAAAHQMLEPQLGDFQGMPALERFAREVGGWPEELEDWRWCARFSYQVIEKRGTGGANFRAMYAAFLREVGSPATGLAETAAAAWTGLAGELLAASEPEEPDAARWAAIAERAQRVHDAEAALWMRLAQA